MFNIKGLLLLKRKRRRERYTVRDGMGYRNSIDATTWRSRSFLRCLGMKLRVFLSQCSAQQF